jgi:hypothetical protein
MHFIALFFTIAVLIMFLGSKQKAHLDKYSVAAILLFLLLEFNTVVFLHGTVLFPPACFSIAMLLCAHKGIVAFNATEDGPDTHPYHVAAIAAAVSAGTVSSFRL